MNYEKPDYHPDPLFYNMRKMPTLAMKSALGDNYQIIKDQVYSLIQRGDYQKADLGFDNFLANMVSAANLNKPFLFSFNKNNYKSIASAGKLHCGYDNMINIYKAFDQLGYTDRVIGYWDADNDDYKRSTIYTTESFGEAISPIFEANVPATSMIAYSEGIQIAPKGTYAFYSTNKTIPIEIRVGEKKEIFPYTANTKSKIRLLKHINEYNEMISGHRILAPLDLGSKGALTHLVDNHHNVCIYNASSSTSTTYNTHSLSYHKQVEVASIPIYYNNLEGQLYRVFNSKDLSCGGRFYGAAYQYMNEEARKHLLLDGEETIELDYSGLHIRMLYNREGIDYSGDPYSFVKRDDPLRGVYKLAALIIINSESFPNAIGALKYELIRKSKKLFGFQISKEEFNYVIKSFGIDNLADILKTMMEQHKSISKYFLQGEGVYLQNMDSQIADNVLYHFTRKDIPCLCIHDSFIVPQSFKDELESVMKEEYRKEMGFDCDVKDK